MASPVLKRRRMAEPRAFQWIIRQIVLGLLATMYGGSSAAALAALGRSTTSAGRSSSFVMAFGVYPARTKASARLTSSEVAGRRHSTSSYGRRLGTPLWASEDNAPSSSNSATPRTAAVQGSPSSSRKNYIQALQEWASSEAAGIQVASQRLLLQADETSGLGWYFQASKTMSAKPLDKGSVVMSVPSAVALTVQCPGDGPDDASVSTTLLTSSPKSLTSYPWFVQMALYLHKLDRIDSRKQSGIGSDKQPTLNYRPWLDSLPRQFDTPLHWSSSELSDAALLQYPHMVQAVEKQRAQWRRYFDSLQKQGGAAFQSMTWDDFIWGCECARSRAFAGTYTGNAFNPSIYAFTLLLVTVYVGLRLGTIEQAANGAGLVFVASILKDFIVPKLTKTKRYVICPMIDMANHQSTANAEVAFEFFGNSYSLALSYAPSSDTSNKQQQLYISYGPRSNDQLLQYYGFIERDNPHDVYIMPPLRSWDIGALETALGRPFAPGRLEKLDRAGLLGRNSNAKDDTEDDGSSEEVLNSSGGVVLNRVQGMDPAVLQALRALVATDAEWNAAGQAIGSFAEENSGGLTNEQNARLLARTAVAMELASKATTIEQDEEMLRRMESIKSLDRMTPSEQLAIQFRLEKKKLLRETIECLK